MQGRGAVLPTPAPHRLEEPFSLVGKGSSECYSGTATALAFKGSGSARRLAKTMVNGGMPADTDVGKPYVDRDKLPGFTGDNPGMTESPNTGPCCTTMVEQVSLAQSIQKHYSPTTRARAMRADLLASMHRKVRTSVAVFDPNATWEDLLDHFMERCGPPNLRAAVHAMLDKSNTVILERTLCQRVSSLFNDYQQAQKTYCGA